MKGTRSYPKVWAVGHPTISNLFVGPVVIQEKIDGSQFSFGVVDGGLKLRSKGVEIFEPVRDKNFDQAVATARRLFDEGKLVDGYIYRCESISKPKHNTLCYDRAPKGGIVLFDIDTGLELRVSDPAVLLETAAQWGLECTPTLFTGVVENVAELQDLLNIESFLGGTKVEGIVIKNYNQWDERSGKMLLGKIVSVEFKEVHSRAWKASNPSSRGILDQIAESLATSARYEKAVQRLRDKGTFAGGLEDIGPLMKAVQQDVEEEEAEFIKEKLFEWARKKVLRGVSKGLPTWYKNRLLESAFEEEV